MEESKPQYQTKEELRTQLIFELDKLKASFAEPEKDVMDMDKFMSLRSVMQAHTYLLVAKRK